MNQLLEVGANPIASIAAKSKDETRRQLELEIYENNKIQSQRRREVYEIYIKRDYNVRDYEERFKRSLHFAI